MVGRFFHVGLVVPDLAAAMAELGPALGLRWREPHTSNYGGWRLTATQSIQEGPPWLELITGSPGSPWEASGVARVDHLGYWSEDLVSDCAALLAAGLALETDGTAVGGSWVQVRAPVTGLGIELIDVARQAVTYLPSS